MNASGWFSFIISSTRIIWPVLLMGSHSVNPSTIPSTIIFNVSIKLITFSPYHIASSLAIHCMCYFFILYLPVQRPLSDILNLPVDGSYALLLQKTVGSAEGPAAEKSPGGRQGAGMGGFQNQMLGIV